MSWFATRTVRERRVIRVGGVVLLAAILGLRIIPAWRAWLVDTRAVARGSIAELARARSGISGLPVLRDSLVASNQRYLALAPSILTGTSAGAVGATLASLVSGAATAAGLEVGAMSIRLDTTRTNVFSRPSVRGDARGDIAGLMRFLTTVEGGPTMLVIRQLAVSQPEPGAPGDRPESLRIEFTIEGIALERAVTEASASRASEDTLRVARSPRGVP